MPRLSRRSKRDKAKLQKLLLNKGSRSSNVQHELQSNSDTEQQPISVPSLPNSPRRKKSCSHVDDQDDEMETLAQMKTRARLQKDRDRQRKNREEDTMFIFQSVSQLVTLYAISVNILSPLIGTEVVIEGEVF